jgi:hypothetical protein
LQTEICYPFSRPISSSLGSQAREFLLETLSVLREIGLLIPSTMTYSITNPMLGIPSESCHSRSLRDKLD